MVWIQRYGWSVLS